MLEIENGIKDYTCNIPPTLFIWLYPFEWDEETSTCLVTDLQSGNAECHVVVSEWIRIIIRSRQQCIDLQGQYIEHRGVNRRSDDHLEPHVVD